VAEAFRRHALGCVQLAPGFPGQPFRDPGNFSPARCHQVAQAFEEASVRVACVAHHANLMDPDLDRRHRGVMRLHALIRHARDFGTRFVVTETGSLAPRSVREPAPAGPTPEAWAELRLIVRMALDLAAEHGVQLLLKPDRAHLLAFIDDALRLRLELEHPALGFVMDPANYLEGGPPSEWRAGLERLFEQLGPWSPLAHAKDVRPSSDGASKPRAGLGALDYPLCLRLLHRHQPDAPIILEHVRPEELAETRAFLEQHLV
jgi:sugar phosphate isomerase/epimerase